MSWEIVNINTICRPRQWKTLSTEKLLEKGYPVYGANGKIGFYSKYTHEFPTLAITCRGATCGSVHITEPKSYINGNAMALDEISKKVDIKFLYFYFESRGFNDVISGSAQPQITGQGLSKIEIPLPPLPIQKRIAEILDAADALKRKDQELLIKYDELAQSIFIDMFGDPVKNEKGWEVKRLKEVCENIYGGGTPSKAHPEYYEGNIPWVTPKDMKSEYINDAIDHINQLAVDNSSTKLIPINSVLMVIRSGILKHTLPVAINTEIVTINQDMKAYIVNSELTNPIFLKYFFYSTSSYLLGKVRAVTADNIEFTQIKEMDFICPDLDLQKRFEKKILVIDKQKEFLKQKIQKMENLFNSLMQKAFKGELIS